MSHTESTRRRFLQTSLLGLGTCSALPAFAQQGSAATTPTPAPVLKSPGFRNYHDAVLAAGAPPPIAPGSFTIAALPDTQRYAKDNPEGFARQTEWLAQHRESRNIVAALHLGDITDNNLPEQWKLAQAAMKRLDGKVPYFMTLGNHDYSANGACVDRTTLFNEYFPLAEQRKAATFGGVYDREPDRLENSYHLLKAGDRDLLILCLEFGPRKDVVRWANEVVARYPKHAAILVTHVYMYYDDTRYDWQGRGKSQRWNPHTYKVAGEQDDVYDGEELWQHLVSKHPNFILTLNGHVLDDGLGRLTSQAGQRQIHQLLFNCQMRPNGGDSWLRLLEFTADGRVEVWDYSPALDQHNLAEENRFSLPLSPIG